MAGAEKKSRSRFEIVFLAIIGLLFVCILFALVSPLDFSNIWGNKCVFPDPIPGLTYEGIADHLGKIGISCNPMNRDAIGYSGYCGWKSSNSLTEISLDIFSSNNPEDIYLVLASVIQLSDNPSDEYASRILGYVATLPYENAEPFHAKSWISFNLSKLTPNSLIKDEPVTEYGGVRYHMSCHNKAIRCLAIGEGSGSGWDYQCK